MAGVSVESARNRVYVAAALLLIGLGAVAAIPITFDSGPWWAFVAIFGLGALTAWHLYGAMVRYALLRQQAKVTARLEQNGGKPLADLAQKLQHFADQANQQREEPK